MQISTHDLTSRVRKAARQVGKAREQLKPELPEKLVIEGLGVVKRRARRRDLVGEAAYRTLRLLNQGLTPTARTLTKFADASMPPVRAGHGNGGQAVTPAAARPKPQPRATKPAETPPSTAQKAG